MKSCDATKKIDREWLLNWLLKWLLKNPVQFFRCDFMHRLFHKPLEILELQRGLVETRGIEPFLVRIRLLLLQKNQILGEVSIALEPNNKT